MIEAAAIALLARCRRQRGNARYDRDRLGPYMFLNAIKFHLVCFANQIAVFSNVALLGYIGELPT